MKKILAGACLFGLLLSACTPAAEPGDDGTLHILATTYPVYLFTTAVTEGAEDVEVSLLVNQPTSCLHDYTLTVSDMRAIEKADVLVMNGAGLEDFMGDALAASDAAVIDCSEGIELLPALGHEGHDHDTEYDPHIWMCEESALVMMNNILHGLGALDEKNLDCYRENAAAAAALVPEDDARMENLACPYLITFHDGFQYFALDNGLNLLKSIEEEEGAEASAAEIQEVVDLVREYEIPAIFTERNGSEATAGPFPGRPAVRCTNWT